MSLKHKCHICLWLSLNLILVFSTTTTTSTSSSPPVTLATSALTNDEIVVVQSSTTPKSNLNDLLPTSAISSSTNVDAASTTPISFQLSTSVPEKQIHIDDGRREKINDMTVESSTSIVTLTVETISSTTIAPTQQEQIKVTSSQPPLVELSPNENDTVSGAEVDENLSNMDNTTTNEKTFNIDGQQEDSNSNNNNTKNNSNADDSDSTTPYLKNINLDDNDNHMSNEINNDDISRKLQSNGLYRIKIGEITTDEFDNGLTSSSFSSSSTTMNEHDKLMMETTVDSTSMPATLPMHKSSKIEKVDIDVFYPSKMEDFKPVIEQSNEKLLREKNILRNAEVTNDKLAFVESTILKPSDTLALVNINTDRNPNQSDIQNVSTTNIEIELIEDTSESVKNGESIARNNIVIDITKELQENDDVITNIEEKFNVDDLSSNGFEEKKFSTNQLMDKVMTSTIQTTTTTTRSINSPITLQPNFFHHDFIMRRVKKNDPIIKFNVFNATPVKKIDFANTKFNTDNTHNSNNNDKSHNSHHDHMDENGKNGKPEFSTTKFYNSKEMYGEMLNNHLNRTDGLHEGMHKIAVLPSGIVDHIVRIKVKEPAAHHVDTTVRQQLLQTNKIPTTENIGMAEYQRQQEDKTTTMAALSMPIVMKSNQQQINSTIQPRMKTKTKTMQKEKKLLHTTNNNDDVEKMLNQVVQPSATSTMATTETITTTVSLSSINDNKANDITETTKTIENIINKTTKPIASHALSHLQEKINSFDCEILNVPMESNVWRGNETHELNLPTTIPEDCTSGIDCSPMIITWEGVAEIQSGDILIVEINDTQLIPATLNVSSMKAHRTTAAVYQVTRLGHEHCDITEGVLLDITPLVVDGKKLVTLYDKDLTEGINLLIVVSDPWGEQCVRLKVTVKSDNCGENTDCSGKGVCFSNASMEGYECQCCSGFAGSHCEEIDACTPSPCTNNGICVDLSQGHEGNAYQCLCPYGYTGKNCQFEADPCNPSQCLNGGTCVGNSTHFRCDCIAGYAGPLCQHNLNECESSPCVHGICVDQEDGFRCFCQPGFSGELCNFEYNECESNPCINGGACIDHIGGFSCKCTRGYTGKRCHLKVDFCATDPCPDGHRCIDHGDEFTCECPGGRNGPDCNQVPRTLCNVNPCSNGGTCWTTEESFYCACRPGFTGKMCEDDFILETVVSSNEILSDLNAESIRAYEEPHHLRDGGGGLFAMHNGYIAAGTLAAAVMIFAVVVSTCYCTSNNYDKVHQTYRNFTNKHQHLIPTFGRKNKTANNNRHWLSGKGNNQSNLQHNNYSNTCQNNNINNPNINNNPNRIIYNNTTPNNTNNNNNNNQERTIINNRPLAMSLENDMYYTVDFSDSQNAPLIQ